MIASQNAVFFLWSNDLYFGLGGQTSSIREFNKQVLLGIIGKTCSKLPLLFSTLANEEKKKKNLRGWSHE